MTKEELESLGLKPADVLERLVERMFDHYAEDEDGYKNDFESRMEKAIKQRVDERLEAAINQHVAPKINELVDNVCLTETNRWGEKKGTPLTFVEYLVQRVDAYIREEVDYQGKPRGTDNYSWNAKSTRIAHMIHEHLRWNIEQAMVKALGEVNSSARKGLAEAVNIALSNIKVTVDTKVKTD